MWLGIPIVVILFFLACSYLGSKVGGLILIVIGIICLPSGIPGILTIIIGLVMLIFGGGPAK